MPRGGRKGGHSGSEAEEYRQWIAGKGPGLIPVPNVNGLRLVPEAICAPSLKSHVSLTAAIVHLSLIATSSSRDHLSQEVCFRDG
jgi:hypothetical protein